MNENNVKKTVEDIASTWNKGDYKSKQQAISKLKMSKWFLPVKTYNFLAEKMGINLRPEESTGESKTEVIEKENILREAQKIMGGRIIDADSNVFIKNQ